MVHRKYGFCRIAMIAYDSNDVLLQFADGRLLVKTHEVSGAEEGRPPPPAPAARSEVRSEEPAPPTGGRGAGGRRHFLVTRYHQIGGGGGATKELKEPELSSVRNAARWDRRKNRVENGTLRLARDLLEVYSSRQKLEREPCRLEVEESREMAEFQGRFAFKPTVDQIQCFLDVRADMVDSKRPMDRLICGDVGFGKTEVAMRAVYRAFLNGRQSALMVPSTILAQQHFESFQKRMPEVPMALLTGKTKASEARATRQALQSGETRLLIGTHALLSEGTKFHELGLLVIDEEQRFGVAQKERIKARQTSLDVLTLSATPIPRTLQMSFVGLRDISLLRTAPEGRQKIRTVVDDISVRVISKAITKELDRGGQVLFVVPRKHNIAKVIASLEKMIPGARVTSAFGGQADVDDSIRRFANLEYDIMVATTIVETGLDLPKANTIIVNHAQLFGISELHQLRGRVGRRSEKGYAYFLTPPNLNATATMKERLRSIAKSATGREVAEADMKIRGAGNILGKDQSGNVGDVGYELYMQMVEEAILDLQAVSLPPAEDCDVTGLVELTPEPSPEALENAIPDNYIASRSERASELLAAVKAENSRRLLQIAGRWERTFGPQPDSVAVLIRALLLRLVLKRLGIESATYDTLRSRVVLEAPRLQIEHWESWASRIPHAHVSSASFDDSRRCIFIDAEGSSAGPATIIGQLLQTFIPVAKFIEDRKAQLAGEERGSDDSGTS